MELESGYLRRNLSNGGQVNRDTFAPIEMRAQLEVCGERSPTGAPVYNIGYITGSEAPPVIPPSVARLLDKMADRYEDLGYPEKAARTRLSEYDKAVLERMNIIESRDAMEAEYFASHRKTGWLRRIILS